MTIRARKLASGKTVYDVEVYCESRDARGRRRKISRTVTTRQEAIKLEARLKVEAEGGGVRDSRRTVEDLITEWLRHKESEGRSPSTIANYRSMAERDILPSLGSVKLDKLGPRHLEKLYASMRARGLATNTIRNTHVPFKG
ncbi:MAG: N-terminal phage integrase SAM-like domain-containing protein, partial [Acidimicrobiia bacterium]